MLRGGFMFNTKIVFIIVFTFSLIGCGGGGGDSKSSSGGSVAPSDDTETSEVDGDKVVAVEVEEVYVEAPPEATVEMSELVASNDFSFTSKAEIEVNLDLSEELTSSGQSDLRAYVSVYSDYTLLSNGQFYADSSSRVVAGELNDDQFTSTFTSLQDQSSYLIEVWFYNGDQPLQKEQQIDHDTLIW